MTRRGPVTETDADALAAAARRGDLDAVRSLAASATVAPADIERALTVAAGRGHVEVVRCLLDGDPALVSVQDNAPLVAAAGGGHLRVVSLLHERGADLQARNGAALPLAADGCHGEVVRYLHRNGAEHSLLSVAGRARIEAMREEVRRAPAIYQPTKIWEFYGDLNSTMLTWDGEENIKRTVNQNYFNFIPETIGDPKTKNLLRLWLRRPTLAPLRYRIEDPDRDPTRWCSWDERYFVFKDNHDERLRLYKWFVGCLYEYGLRSDPDRLLARLEEPLLGNPIRVWRGRRLVSQDLVNSVRERNTLVKNLGDERRGVPRVIAELGAGYGRLAYVVLSSTSYRYFVFDIPPALYISEWYLSRLFPERRIFRFRPFGSYREVADELDSADIAFLTANQLEKLPDRYIDAFATISSLHEMRPEQIAHFLSLMTAKSRELVYVKQHEDYVNPWDGLRIRRGDYGVPDGWVIADERPDVVNPGFFELLLRPRRPQSSSGHSNR